MAQNQLIVALVYTNFNRRIVAGKFNSRDFPLHFLRKPILWKYIDAVMFTYQLISVFSHLKIQTSGAKPSRNDTGLM